ncbi:MAG TPA: hypothetical protein VKK81_03725 [Candidatus Binatia bacterium]|nr:hypothetical protein [Candidatus Binatia bacterium]
MTHDARLRSSVAHLPTLEQIMNGNNPFEILATPLGTMERWRAEAMLIGTTGGIQSVLQTVRNDAAELEKKTVELDAKKSAVLSTVNRLLRFMSRVDALTSRVEALEAKRKADEAVQRKLDEEFIELPPDIAEYQTLSPPRKIEDETPTPSGHTPGGELHQLPAKTEDQEPVSELPEPPEPETTSDAGGVPLSYGNVPLSYVRGGPRDTSASQKDQAGDLPEELEQGLPEPPPEPKGSVYPQPTAISLNEE